METEQYWSVYDCSIVDLGEGGAGYPKLPRAVRIDREKELKKAVALPRGFVTKVLLDYDFSDDEQMLSFLREYGPVMCPYAGAIDRTFAAIEDPLSYRRLLHSVVSERQAEDERRDGGAFARLFGIVRDMRDRMGSRDRGSLDPSENFSGCDYAWDAKRLFYSGMTASVESDYLRAGRRGFVRYLEDDDKLVGTERLRALAWNEAAYRRHDAGFWEVPPCLISLEETRAVLYLLQMASVVLQGFSYIDDTASERHSAGLQRRRYVSALKPASLKGVRKGEAEKIERAASRVGGMQLDIRRVERLFDLFIKGRPNLIKAFCAVSWEYLPTFEEPDSRPGMPDGILNDSEAERVDEIVRKALERSGDDPETLALLERRPLWQAWDGLQGDLAIFLEACLTNCWGTYGHRLVSKESLRVDGLEDGGAYFGGSADRMTLQRAIAEQIVENLDLARKKHPETRRKGTGDDPVWQVCSVCGSLYMARSRSRKLVLLGEEKPSRFKIPTATTCSEACRMAATRA